jgi:arylsulfatase A-like enzyme
MTSHIRWHATSWLGPLTLQILVTAIFLPSSLAQERPNILFLFADDFTFEAVSAMGLTDIETPNLDRLAARGTTFTHAYNMGGWNGAVCVASRNMLMTGRSVWRAQGLANATEKEREQGRLWPQLLMAGGYESYMTGKWHIQANAEGSFDVARHVRPGMPSTVENSYNRPLPGQPDTWSPTDKANGGFWEGGKHWTEVAADDAIEFLDRAKHRPAPFFMYIAFNAPHDPRQAPQEYLDKYPVERIRVPASFQPLYPFKDQIGCGPGLRDEKLAPFPRTEHAVKVHRREYYALITHLDSEIGRILSALEATGKAENTWIFFTADHGLAVGNHGLIGKQNMYDHSLRVPFIVVGPNVKPKHRISAPIYLQDAMATTLELANAPKPASCEFNSLLPLLSGAQQNSCYPSIYGCYINSQRCVIHDNWKLIVYPQAKVARLYNLNHDPLELNDLANDPAQIEVKKQLFAKLLDLQSTYEDKLVLDPIPF